MKHLLFVLFLAGALGALAEQPLESAEAVPPGDDAAGAGEDNTSVLIADAEARLAEAQAERFRLKHRLEYQLTDAIPLRMEAKKAEGELVEARNSLRERIRILELTSSDHEPGQDPEVIRLREQVTELESAHREAVDKLNALLDEQPAVLELDIRRQNLAAELQQLRSKPGSPP